MVSVPFCYFTKRKQGNLMTPSCLLIITYIFVLGVQFIACCIYELPFSTFDCFAIYFVFFSIAFLCDDLGYEFARRVSFNGKRLINGNSLISKSSSIQKLLKFLSAVAVILCIYYFISISMGLPLHYIVTENVQNQYASKSFLLRLFLMITSTYYLGISKFSRTNVIWGCLLLIPNILTFVKGIIMIPVLASIIIRIKNQEIKISPNVVIKICLTGVVVFYGVYLAEEAVYDINKIFDVNTYDVISAKFLHYFIGGVQSFCQNIIGGYDQFTHADNVTLTPFINLLAKFGITKSINSVNSIRQNIVYNNGLYSDTNINGYVGMLYLFDGFFVGNILNAFWVFFTSFMSTISLKKNDLVTAMSSLFLCAFALGWFDFYFVQTFWLYLIIIAGVMKFLFYIMI
jgi:hypothetical protein